MEIKNGQKEKVNRSETQDYQQKSNYIKASAEGTSRANVSVGMHHRSVKSGKISI